MTAPAAPLLTRLADLVWVDVPLALRRFSAGLAVVAVDGLYLAARPAVGLAVPSAALVLGLLAGAFHPGFELVFTEALWLLMLVAAVGAASGAAGLYLTLGFVLGDLLLGAHPGWTGFGNFLAKGGAVLLTYTLFAMLAVGVPVAAKSLSAELRLPATVPRAIRALVGLAALIGVSGLLVFGWTQSAPLLVRPLFVWAGGAPTVPSISPLQNSAGWIVAAAVVASIGRAIAQLRLARSIRPGEPRSDRMTELEDRFRTPERVEPLMSRLPLIGRLFLRAAVLTWVLSGLYASIVQALLVFAVVFGAQIVTSPMLPFDLGAYARFMARVPRLARLLVALLPVYFLGSLVIHRFGGGTSFAPFLLMAVVSVVLMTLLNPVPREGAAK
jgi:hypothetical protein